MNRRRYRDIADFIGECEWMVCDGPYGYQHRIFNPNEGGDTVCDVVKSRYAGLIAAAPELLEALDSIVTSGLSTSRIAAARAAIAKATGATP